MRTYLPAVVSEPPFCQRQRNTWIKHREEELSGWKKRPGQKISLPKEHPPEVGGVEAAPRTSKRNQPLNAGIVARKATRRASVGRSAAIWRKLDPDPGGSNKEIGSGRTTPKDRKGLKKSERGHPSWWDTRQIWWRKSPRNRTKYGTLTPEHLTIWRAMKSGSHIWKNRSTEE